MSAPPKTPQFLKSDLGQFRVPILIVHRTILAAIYCTKFQDSRARLFCDMYKAKRSFVSPTPFILEQWRSQFHVLGALVLGHAFSLLFQHDAPNRDFGTPLDPIESKMVPQLCQVAPTIQRNKKRELVPLWGSWNRPFPRIDSDWLWMEI